MRLRSLAGQVFALGLCFAAWAASAQPVVEGEFDTVVANYVAEGLRSNLALQSQHLEVEKSTQALQKRAAEEGDQLARIHAIWALGQQARKGPKPIERLRR